MRASLFLIASLMIQSAGATGLVPATSEDLDAFDRQIQASQTQESKRPATNLKNSKGFGVSAEAKKQKDAAAEDRQSFGQWVSEQRQSDRANSNPGAGISNDARNSSPALNNSGGGPGNSGNKKK